MFPAFFFKVQVVEENLVSFGKKKPVVIFWPFCTSISPVISL